MKPELGIAGRLAQAFLNSKLTPLFIVASLAIGAFSVLVIPREEEPQIIVPMLDITTALPGASPAEVEERVTLPIETLVHQISGVEYVYSTSSPGQSLVIVRFLVGTPQEDALIKVYSKLYSNADRMAPGASQPLIKARSIDDVPILAMTLWGPNYNGKQLRAIAAEMQQRIGQIPDVSETAMIGGLPRTMRVLLSTEKLNAYGLSPLSIVGHLQAANASAQAGNFAESNEEVRVEVGNLFTRREDLGAVVVGVVRGHPVYLRDVADQVWSTGAQLGRSHRRHELGPGKEGARLVLNDEGLDYKLLTSVQAIRQVERPVSVHQNGRQSPDLVGRDGQSIRPVPVEPVVPRRERTLGSRIGRRGMVVASASSGSHPCRQ